jgi:DNA processing protein
MHEQAMFYNAVSLAMHGDPAGIWKLKERCEISGNLFTQDEHVPLWKIAYDRLLRDGHHPPDPFTAAKALDDLGVRLILYEDLEYPTRLKEIPDPPLGLYVRGELKEEMCFAIVGTRRATTEGIHVARKFSRDLTGAGFVIVSGLAFGIDAAGHEGCLEVQGRTIAVLAGGLHEIYPTKNTYLGEKILALGGAIISEYPLGEPPYPHRFLERNRIISGLSRGVLIIECPLNSGSRVTGGLALKQNRDVFVIPGSITHPNFSGSHELIRQGATLVTKPEDIFQEYEMCDAQVQPKTFVTENEEERLILSALQSTSGPLIVDKIIETTRLEPRIANQTLSFLVIKGMIKETDTGYIIE